jgi:ferric-dicitrate binding protein FerR (iron transport regulator)
MASPHDSDLLEQLDRYLAGECSPPEVERLERALAGRRLYEPTLRYLQRRLAEVPEAPPESRASLMALMRRIEGATAQGTSMPVRPSRRFTIPRFGASRTTLVTGAIAAGAALAFIGGVTWQRIAQRPADASSPAGAREYKTAAGQRLALQLYDGTQVIVAPNSTLRIPADYGASRRDVYLDGAAYFDVAASARRPFTAYAAQRSIRVLGTAFAVDGYREDSVVTVTVKTGKVALSQAGILAAGDVGSVSASGQHTIRHGQDVADRLAWTTGRLVFHDTPVPQLLARLGRWYGMHVRTDDPTIRAQLITITFDGDSRSEALGSLAKLLEATLVWDAQGAVLVPVHGASRTTSTPLAGRP